MDLDGTLAVFLDNDQIGPPIPANIAKCQRLAGQGWQIDIFTSRPWHQYDLIAAFCDAQAVPWSEIQCGKPLYAAYVDDKAINADDTDWTPRTP